MEVECIPWKRQFADEAHARVKLFVSRKLSEINGYNKRDDVCQEGSMIEKGYRQFSAFAKGWVADDSSISGCGREIGDFKKVLGFHAVTSRHEIHA